MDPEKVWAMFEWPTPTNRKHLQWFLGFANFYQKCIKDFSMVASPLHSLTYSNTQFIWSFLLLCLF